MEEEPDGPPHAAKLAWGNFVLAERIAAKLDAGDPLNFVVSLTATGATSSASFEHGWAAAAGEVSEQHGVEIDARVIGPNSADVEAQAATIESLIASADIDCLAVEAASPRLLTDVIDLAVDAGIPVFAVGGDSPDSKRFAFYGLDDYAAGETAGSLVGQWAADGGILVRRAGVLTGDAGDQRSFDLMRGFVAGLSEIHSGVDWVNGPADVDSFGFDPFAVYDATEAWVLDNIDADIVFHTDEGLEALASGDSRSTPLRRHVRRGVPHERAGNELHPREGRGHRDGAGPRRAGPPRRRRLRRLPARRRPRHRPRGDRAGGGDP